MTAILGPDQRRDREVDLVFYGDLGMAGGKALGLD